MQYGRFVVGELNRETILAALSRLSELLKERAANGELCLLGGP
jgi:hypothetical protein